MTKFLVLICAVVGFGGPAVAADLPAPAPAAVYVPPAVPVYNWTGSYVGINGGWGWGSAQWTVAPIPTILASGLSNSINDNGGVVGGTLGFNWQIPGFGGFVFGAEGDWDYSAINTGTTATVCNFSGNCQTGNNWLATLRGRAGYAADRVLFYATAGGAFANMQTSFNGVTTGHTQTGWTAGAGVEWAFAENWSAKVEYLYVNLGSGTVTCTLTPQCTFPATGIPVSVGLTENLVRAGINFKFYYP